MFCCKVWKHLSFFFPALCTPFIYQYKDAGDWRGSGYSWLSTSSGILLLKRRQGNIHLTWSACLYVLVQFATIVLLLSLSFLQFLFGRLGVISTHYGPCIWSQSTLFNIFLVSLFLDTSLNWPRRSVKTVWKYHKRYSSSWSSCQESRHTFINVW